MATTARRRRNRTALFLVMLLLGLLVARHLTSGTSERIAIGTQVEVSGASARDERISTAGKGSFGIGSTVDDLVPGHTSTLMVTLTNHGAAPYRLTELTATALDASAACPAAGNLVLTSYRSASPESTTYVLPTGGTVTVPLTLTFVDSAHDQSACRGATFPLRFAGTATRASDTEASS